MNNFTKRTLSGAVYVALVVASIVMHPAFFGILFLMITMLAIQEFHGLMHSSLRLTTASMIAGMLFFGAMWLIYLYDQVTIEVVALLLVAHLAWMMWILVRELWTQAPDPIRNWGNALISQWMIALPFAAMNFIMNESKWLLLALFITIWINDSGAYCIGCLMAKRKGGNHKMFPRVSPNKSWEGLIGGFVFALIAGYVFFRVGWIEALWQAELFTFVIAVTGTLGDLMESLFKRTLGVKDSGRFMPGHGGVLDRFDSILLATPAAAILLFVLG